MFSVTTYTNPFTLMVYFSPSPLLFPSVLCLYKGHRNKGGESHPSRSLGFLNIGSKDSCCLLISCSFCLFGGEVGLSPLGPYLRVPSPILESLVGRNRLGKECQSPSTKSRNTSPTNSYTKQNLHPPRIEPGRGRW